MHLGRDQPERLEHAHEVVQHPVGNLARDEPRREVPEQPRLALSAAGPSPILGGPPDQDADDERHGQEHHRGDRLLGALELQGEPLRLGQEHEP